MNSSVTKFLIASSVHMVHVWRWKMYLLHQFNPAIRRLHHSQLSSTDMSLSLPSQPAGSTHWRLWMDSPFPKGRWLCLFIMYCPNGFRLPWYTVWSPHALSPVRGAATPPLLPPKISETTLSSKSGTRCWISHLDLYQKSTMHFLVDTFYRPQEIKVYFKWILWF